LRGTAADSICGHALFVAFICFDIDQAVAVVVVGAVAVIEALHTTKGSGLVAKGDAAVICLEKIRGTFIVAFAWAAEVDRGL